MVSVPEIEMHFRSAVGAPLQAAAGPSEESGAGNSGDSRASLESKRTTELREICQNLGIDDDGEKEVLVNRLLELTHALLVL